MKPKLGEKPSLKYKTVWFFEFIALYIFKFFFNFLPYKIKIKTGKRLGLVFFSIDKKHREVCKKNIMDAFPELSVREVEDLSKKTFENIGRLFVEVVFLKTICNNLFSYSSVSGWENLQQVVSMNKGYFLVSGHFGNWEFVAYRQSQLGYALEMVTRPLDNPYLERYFRRIRENCGNRVIYKRNAVKEMVKSLKQKKGVAFVFDQNFGEEGAFFVPFFGKPAATTPALGKVASHLKIPILPVFAIPEEFGYKIVYKEPILPERYSEFENVPLILTKEVTKMLEENVRKTPYAWFWLHERWRTKEEDFKKEAGR